MRRSGGTEQVEHRRVVALPQRQPEGVGVLVPALERERHLERVPHADDEAEIGNEVEPVRRGQTGARVLEPPVVVLAQRGDRRGGGLGDVRDPRIVDGLRWQVGRVVPRAAGGLEQLVVAGDDRLVLPEALGVVLGGVDELLGAGADQVEPGVVQRA